MHTTEHCKKGTLGNAILLKEQAIDSNMHLTLILGLTHTFQTTTNQQDRHKVSNTKQAEALHLNGVVLLSFCFPALSRFSTSKYSFYKLRKLNVTQE